MNRHIECSWNVTTVATAVSAQSTAVAAAPADSLCTGADLAFNTLCLLNCKQQPERHAQADTFSSHLPIGALMQAVYHTLSKKPLNLTDSLHAASQQQAIHVTIANVQLQLHTCSRLPELEKGLGSAHQAACIRHHNGQPRMQSFPIAVAHLFKASKT